MKAKKNCRYCNHILELDSPRCPACNHSQSRIKEFIALAIAALIIGTVAYLQLFYNATEHPDRRIATAPTAPPAQAVQHHPNTSPKRPPIQHTPSKQPSSFPSSQTVSYQGTSFRQQAGDYPFYTAEKKWNPQRKKYEFWRKGMYGSEIRLRGDSRRYFLSENQSNYPEPASGCGPTALLNLYIWYTKFGLLKESVRHSNPTTYKRLKFQEIDHKLLNIQRASRTSNGGTNTLAAIVTMDELVQKFGQNSARLHFEIKRPPLQGRDFTNLSQGYRAGILSVRPKSRQTGQLMGNHAVLCIRGDTAGMITIANWGEFSHGSLVQRSDGQWFIPRDPAQNELRINTLTTLIPFVPRNG